MQVHPAAAPAHAAGPDFAAAARHPRNDLPVEGVQEARRAGDLRHHPLLLDEHRGLPGGVLRLRPHQGGPVGQRHHRHGAGTLFPGHGLCAAASLHGRRGRIDRLVGLRAWRHGRGVEGAGQRVQVLRRRNHHRRRRQTSVGQRQSCHRRGLRQRQRIPRENRGFEPRPQAHLHQAVRSEGSAGPSSSSARRTSRSAVPRAS